MCILVQEPDTALIAEDVQANADRACEKIQAMAKAAIRRKAAGVAGAAVAADAATAIATARAALPRSIPTKPR